MSQGMPRIWLPFDKASNAVSIACSVCDRTLKGSFNGVNSQDLDPLEEGNRSTMAYTAPTGDQSISM